MSPTTPGAVLAALLAVDVALGAAHVLGLAAAPVSSAASATWQSTSVWSLSADRSLAERFGYLQAATAAGLLALAAWSSRRPTHLAWAALLTVVVLDDALFLHERGGAALVRWAGVPDPPTGLRAQDLGELAVWGLLGVLPLAAVVLAHRRSDAVGRRRSAAVAVCLAALVGCEVVLDLLHEVAPPGLPATTVGMLEDGGGLVVLSATAATALGLWRLERREALARAVPGGHPPR